MDQMTTTKGRVMAVKCPNCGQVEGISTGASAMKCLNCGKSFDFSGNILKPTGETNLVGNYADLQRMGQQIIAGGDTEDAVLIPQNVGEEEAREAVKEDLENQLTDGNMNTPTDEKKMAKKEADAAKNDDSIETLAKDTNFPPASARTRTTTKTGSK